VKRINADGRYIDYFQSLSSSPQALTNRFGVRICEGRCFALIVVGDQEPTTFGNPHEIPIQPEALPSHLRIVVDDHCLNYPDSDLIDVLAGRKSFHDALTHQQELQVY
jgi:hypothetical protein